MYLLKTAVSLDFNVREVSADKTYLSRVNYTTADDLSISAYIPFRSDSSGLSKGATIWKKMFYRFHERQDESEKHCYRSENIETYSSRENLQSPVIYSFYSSLSSSTESMPTSSFNLSITTLLVQSSSVTSLSCSSRKAAAFFELLFILTVLSAVIDKLKEEVGIDSVEDEKEQ